MWLMSEEIRYEFWNHFVCLYSTNGICHNAIYTDFYNGIKYIYISKLWNNINSKLYVVSICGIHLARTISVKFQQKLCSPGTLESSYNCAVHLKCTMYSGKRRLLTTQDKNLSKKIVFIARHAVQTLKIQFVSNTWDYLCCVLKSGHIDGLVSTSIPMQLFCHVSINHCSDTWY